LMNLLELMYVAYVYRYHRNRPITEWPANMYVYRYHTNLEIGQKLNGLLIRSPSCMHA